MSIARENLDSIRRQLAEAPVELNSLNMKRGESLRDFEYRVKCCSDKILSLKIAEQVQQQQIDQEAREAARRMQCTNNLKQMGISLHNYSDVYNAFPATENEFTTYGGTVDWRNDYGGHIALLPFLEQSAAYDRLLTKMSSMSGMYPWSATANWGAGSAEGDVRNFNVPSFVCPSDPSPNYSPDDNWVAGDAGKAATTYMFCVADALANFEWGGEKKRSILFQPLGISNNSEWTES